MRSISWLLVCIWTLLSCGDRSNNRIWVSPKDKARFDVLLIKAQACYDRGEFDDAAESAQAAYAFNSKSEKAAQLLAFSKLGQIGFDVPSLAQFLITISNTQNLANLLLALKQLLNIREQDLLAMSTKKEVSTNLYFVGLDLYFPKTPGDYTNTSDPRGSVPLLLKMNEVIAVMCPFVPADLRGSGARYACTDNTGFAVHPSQTLILYAMAHLAEAVAFNSLLFYSSNTQTSTSATSDPLTASNLLQRINTFSKITSGDEDTIVGAFSEMATAYVAIVDPSVGSMESEILVDFSQVINAFKRISGLPSSVIGSLNTAMAQLTNIQTTSGEITQAQAYQKQITAKFSAAFSKAGAQIAAAIAQSPNPGAAKNLQTVCNSIETILGGSDSLPTDCDNL